MFVNGEKIIKVLENIANPSLSEGWDNCGLIIGSPYREVNKILVALEINEAVVNEAVSKSVDMIVTHHPLIFKAMKKITDLDPVGKLVLKLAKQGISLYSLHTNLDATSGGINDYLANRFSLKNLQPLVVSKSEGLESGFEGLGRVGELEVPTPITEVLLAVKSILGLDDIRFNGKTGVMVKRVALCSGAGADFIELAHKLGADLYLTGDLKHHDYRDAELMGLNIADIGHFESENVYMGTLKEKMIIQFEQKDYDVKVVLSENLKSSYQSM